MEEKQQADTETKLGTEQQEISGANPSDFKRLILATEARQLMVRSVRGLDTKLNEISQIIQTTARKGETRAEVYSIQTNRSSLPAIERIDNLGRVLLEALRHAGYEAKLKEFRTSDSCMLYILADWSKISESKPEEPPRRASGIRPRPAARPGRDPQVRDRSPAPGSTRTAGAPSARARPNGKANASAADPSADSNDATKVAQPEEETKNPKDGDTSATDQVNAEAPDFGVDPDSKEVKTKKFDPKKMVKKEPASNTSRPAEVNAAETDNKADIKALTPDDYSTEINGERIPIILPIVMPLRMPLLQ